MSNHHHFSFLFILLLLCLPTYSHFVTDGPSSSSDLVSDGVHSHQYPSDLLLNRFSAESTCHQTYGFLPCSTSVMGNMFLIIVYGYLIFLGAKYLTNGSELLTTRGPGIVGGSLLPIFGDLSEAMLILVSGLSESLETAQRQVSIGMGMLAGSTIMLLTILWGTCAIVGKCDLVDSVAQDGQDTKGFSFTESGVSTDPETSYAARIMVISVIPFLIVQIPQALSSTSGRHLVVLIGLIISLLLLISYCTYQVLQPEIQTRKIDYVKHKEIDPDKEDAVDRLMKDFDRSYNELIDRDEFFDCVCRNLNKETKRKHDLGTTIKAGLLLLLGTAIAAAFADPLVVAVDNFSHATGIPDFFISFVALPLATHSSDAVKAIIVASREKCKTASLTFSELYATVTMNNLQSLLVFLALVYIRGLTWNFSSEVLVIAIVCIVMGALSSFRTHFPLWTSILALLLYPFSLALVYVLQFVLGWS